MTDVYSFISPVYHRSLRRVFFRGTPPVIVEAQLQAVYPLFGDNHSVGSPCWARTSDPQINSLLLYLLS